MGWQTDDGRHEGWAAAQFAGDRLSFGSTGEGAMVARYDLTTGAHRAQDIEARAPTVLDGREALGWRGVCECGWLGPLWRRTSGPAEHDPAAHRVHHPDPGRYGQAPAEVEEAIWAEWMDHVEPLQALEAVRAAAGEAAAAQDRLTEAVRAARLAGSSWADIGGAVGISRQSAHERWARACHEHAGAAATE